MFDLSRATDKKFKNEIKYVAETTKIASDEAAAEENVPIKAEDERPDIKSTSSISEDLQSL